MQLSAAGCYDAMLLLLLLAVSLQGGAGKALSYSLSRNCAAVRYFYYYVSRITYAVLPSATLPSASAIVSAVKYHTLVGVEEERKESYPTMIATSS